MRVPVTLVGLIAKHGILITEFANQLREKGMTKIDALVKAASLRLRPILMTTAAMVIGAIPLAFASAAYDSGQGTVEDAIRYNIRHHEPTDFWHLHLPRETERYVPKLLALAQLVKFPICSTLLLYGRLFQYCNWLVVRP